MAGNWQNQKVRAGDVMDMIDNRLSAIDMKYQYGSDERKTAENMAYAEIKMQVAELKMIFVDLVLEEKQKELDGD